MIRPYFHPTTVVVIDDNQMFLRALDLELPDGHVYQLHHEPEAALQAVNNTPAIPPLAERVFASSDADLDMSFATLGLDLSLIEQEIKRAERFCHVSVVVIDYSMPSMDGIEFSRSITNREVQRLLLTGVADEKLAVEAFNAGLIDRFLPKQKVDALSSVFRDIDALIERYFANLESRLQHALRATMRVFNDNPSFVEFFNNFLDQHGIVEYYAVGDPTGFLLVDAGGRLRRILATTEQGQLRQADYAAERDAPGRVVDDLKSGRRIGYFIEPPETFFGRSNFSWDDYLHPARPCGEDLIVAIVEDPPTDIDFNPDRTSFTACARELTAANTRYST